MVSADSHGDAGFYGHADAKRDGHRYRNRDRHRYRDDHPNRDRDRHRYRDADQHTSHANRYRYADAHDDGDRDRRSDTYLYLHADADRTRPTNRHRNRRYYWDYHFYADAGTLSQRRENFIRRGMDTVTLLKRLSEAVGLSGYEKPVRALIKKEFSRYADEVRTDKMGSLIALKRGQPVDKAETPPRRIMLAAHMDEIGLMVSGVEEGFLRVEPVGGVDKRLLVSQPVTVHSTGDGPRDLPGVVASVPPHLLSSQERKKIVPFEKLFVDVGLPQDKTEKMVHIGDLISFRQEALELKGGLLTGKAMDNRASVAAVILCMELLAGMQHNWDVYAVATVQEEVGLKGALTGAFGVNPDVAIAIDVTWAEQSGVPQDQTFPMGKGPTIGVGPNFHPALHQALLETAQAQEIPYHIEPAPGSSGTDAWAIQISREGVPTALLGIPERYMHSPVEVIAVKDVERTSRLLAHFIAGLTPDFMDTLTLHPEPAAGSESVEGK
jgi:endoglucanase